MNHFFEKFWVSWGLAAILGLLLMRNIASGQTAPHDRSNWLAVGPQELQRENIGSIFPGPLLESGPHMVWIAAKQHDTAWPYSMWRSYGPYQVTAGRSYLVTVQNNGIPVVSWKEWGVRSKNEANPNSLASVFYLNLTTGDQILGITVVPALGQVPTVVITGTLTTADPQSPRHPYPHKVHSVYLEEGKTYVCAMTSNEFDTYLMLEDEAGATLAWTDDNGTVLTNRALGARLTFQPPATGTYRIIAAPLGSSAEGSYLITLREPPVVMRVEDELTASDEMRNDCHVKTYDVSLRAGRRYFIDLESKEFGTCVKLLNPAGMIVAFDEGGVGRNTRIVFEPMTTGMHRIVATSATEHATGAFALAMREEE